jgi:hypothetical protein
MRLFFPPQFGVRLQGIARPLPGEVHLVQLAANRIVRGPQARAVLDLLLKQRHRPGGVRVAKILRRTVQQTAQQALDALAQQRRPPRPLRIGQGGRVEGCGIGSNPVGDALATHAEHPGNVGGGAATVELQDRQGAAVQPGVTGLGQLPLQTPALVTGQL